MNQTKPKVSVIIPVYNAEPFLRECLDSVVGQSLKEIEIILVDDGSTDSSLSILREYEAKDGRVCVVTQPNINAGAARNNGLSRASGEYLSFLDADDVFELDMLEKAYGKAKKEEAEILVFRCDLFYAENKTVVEKDSVWAHNLPEKTTFAGTEIKKNLFRSFVGWAWDKLFLRSFVEENHLRFQEQRTSNDLLFTYLSLAKASRITVLEECLAHHRTQVKGSLEATRIRSVDCCYQALIALRDALKEAGLYARFEQDFVNFSLNFLLWNLETIPWPAHEVLFYKLKLIWLNELNVAGREKEYFYEPQEYERLVRILEKPYNDLSPEEIQRRFDEKDRLLAERDRDVAARDRMLEEIQGSVSYRVGRAATWLPRKILRGSRNKK